MACWNGLSTEQQHRLITVGNLPWGYQPEGECQRGAAVAVEAEGDMAPGPRFYCHLCAIDYVRFLHLDRLDPDSADGRRLGSPPTNDPDWRTG